MKEAFRHLKNTEGSEQQGFKVINYTVPGLGVVAVCVALNIDRIADLSNELRYADKLAGYIEKESDEDREHLLQKIKEIKERIGVGNLSLIAGRVSDPSSETANEDLRPPQVVGFEDSDLVSNEDVQNLLHQDFFPYGWTTNLKVSYQPEALKITDNVNAAGKFSDFADKIVIYSIKPNEYFIDKRMVALSALRNTLNHEVCHRNDWWTRHANPDFNSRVDLLYKVIGRVESTDAYNEKKAPDSSGLDVPYHVLHGLDSNLKRNLAYKEYFASVCEAYLADPEDFKDKFPKDYNLVNDWIEQYEPDFRLRYKPLDSYHEGSDGPAKSWVDRFGPSFK